jgi:cyanate lyase
LNNNNNKEQLVERLLEAKAKSGLTFDQLAEKLGVTNAYVAQLMMNQAQLKPATALKLKEALPAISDEDIITMKKEPFRSFNPTIMQEPMIYRFVEAMQHYGEGLKLLVNERKGDGILSAIDIYVSMDIIKGTMDEDRIVITLNGKFLPHVEQLVSNNTAVVSGKRG